MAEQTKTTFDGYWHWKRLGNMYPSEYNYRNVLQGIILSKVNRYQHLTDM